MVRVEVAEERVVRGELAAWIVRVVGGDQIAVVGAMQHCAGAC